MFLGLSNEIFYMIRYLKTFSAAAELGSFSAAGARLGLTQSAVSTQMRRLEAEFGCLLFQRSGKAIELSDRGRTLLSHIHHVIELYDALKVRATELVAETIGLGAISTVQSSLLPGILHKLKEHRPQARINICPGTSAELLAKVDSRELDIAVMIKPHFGVPSDLDWVPLIDDKYIAVASSTVKESVEEWPHCLPFIRYDRRSFGGRIVDRYLRRHKLKIHEGMELDEPSIIAKMVAQGLGWSIIPEALIDLPSINSIQSAQLPGAPLYRNIGLLIRPPIAEASAIRVLVDEFKVAFGR
jgi:DNA-binding transcriptional LysR family regulator